MTRIDYLRERSTVKNPDYLDLTILNSLIQSLKYSEACTLFDFTFNQEYHIRHYILKKISDDISKEFSTLHKNLVKTLLMKLNEKGFAKKDSCAFSLDLIYENCPSRYKTLILKSFLNSKSSRNRDRAYKKINSDWHNKYHKQIELTWSAYQDSSCLDIILTYFSDDFLLNNYRELVSSV